MRDRQKDEWSSHTNFLNNKVSAPHFLLYPLILWNCLNFLYAVGTSILSWNPVLNCSGNTDREFTPMCRPAYTYPECILFQETVSWLKSQIPGFSSSYSLTTNLILLVLSCFLSCLVSYDCLHSGGSSSTTEFSWLSFLARCLVRIIWGDLLWLRIRWGPTKTRPGSTSSLADFTGLLVIVPKGFFCKTKQ